jgi:hypothetical protein
MGWPLDDRFKTVENDAVIAFIEREQPSAHDDVASALTESAKGLTDVHWYCPDPHAYAYVVLYTRERTIFGIAFGMRALAYRLPQDVIQDAVAEGGTVCPDIGDDWLLFHPWGTPVRLKHWCKTAHDHAVALRAVNRP